MLWWRAKRWQIVARHCAHFGSVTTNDAGVALPTGVIIRGRDARYLVMRVSAPLSVRCAQAKCIGGCSAHALLHRVPPVGSGYFVPAPFLWGTGVF